MKLISLFLAFASFLNLSCALTLSSITVRCSTQYATTSAQHLPLPRTTRTSTSTKTITSMVTKRLITTISASPAFPTTLSTAIRNLIVTASQATSTLSSTINATDSQTATSIVTRTDTIVRTVMTTSSSTTTVPTPAGFTPLASNAAVSGARTAKKRRSDIESDDIADSDHTPATRLGLPRPSLKQRGLSCNKPSQVLCEKLVEVTKVIARTITQTSTTQIRAPTLTRSIVVTLTSISTVKPRDAIATEFVTTTSTEFKTAVVTRTTNALSTTTETAVADATATVYAQCQANNMIDNVGGRPIVFPEQTYEVVDYALQENAEACCINCAQNGGCGGFSFDTDQKICVLFGGGGPDICDGSIESFIFSTNDDFAQQVIGNGRCGQGTFEP